MIAKYFRRAVAKLARFALRKRYFIQFRPDSDFDHGHMKPDQQLMRDWVKGMELNNRGDMTRFYMLYQNLLALNENNIPGAMAELGVWKGNSAKLLHKVSPDRKLYLFDTFTGFDKRDVEAEAEKLPVDDTAFCDTSIEGVRNFIEGEDKVVFCPGWFPETTSVVPEDEVFSLVHVDCDLGKPVTSALEYFYPCLSPGGMMIIHDYSSGWWKDVKPAVDAFMADKPEGLILMPDKSGSVAFIKARP